MLCRVSYILVNSTYLLFSVKSQFVINAERDFSVYYTVQDELPIIIPVISSQRTANSHFSYYS